MTFGPVSAIVRPGATISAAIVGPRGAPGKDGQSIVGPVAWLPAVPWATLSNYVIGPPASVVTIGGSSFVARVPHTATTFLADWSSGFWAQIASVGATGAPGSVWYTGVGVPGTTIGVAGDYYLQADTGDVFQRAATSWGQPVANLKGLKGDTGLAGNTVRNGTGAPAATVGVNGDFYLDTAASVLYGPKSGGAWPSSGTSLVGPKGKDGTGAGTVINNGAATVGDVAIFDAADGTRIKSGGRPGFTLVDTPTSPYTCVNRDEVWWNTASGPVTQLLPANPVAGNRVKAVRSGANTVTVQGNGSTIAGVSADLVLDQDKQGVELIWDTALATWSVILLQHA